MRLELDACKARLRNIRGMRPADLQNEVESLEKEFKVACEDAVQEMKTFVQYVNQVANGQLTFYLFIRLRPLIALRL